MRHRDAVFGVPTDSRKQRREVLERLIGLFDGHDVEQELRALKEADEGF